ncbi:hypothetical protein KLP28_15300 [Nocardioidaceae bacterium]|nr:hypothetical protein KLP28_15300 [Nocardioidaceae bacterium]
MLEGEPLSGAALYEAIAVPTRRQVPSQLPIQVRITPDRDTVLWLDGFRRWRGALSFQTSVRLTVSERVPWFAHPDGAFNDDELEDLGMAPRLPIDVVAVVDGVELRSSSGQIVSDSAGFTATTANGSWMLPVPDDVRALRIRLECEALPLHRIIELDCDLLRTALDDVWVL